MLTSKQRAKLRTLANPLETILQVGKGGIGEQLVKQVDDALRARELIKMRVLETAPGFPREIAHALAEQTNCRGGAGDRNPLCALPQKSEGAKDYFVRQHLGGKAGEQTGHGKDRYFWRDL